MDLSEAMPLLLKKIESMNRRRAAAKIIACAVRTHHLSSQYKTKRAANELIVRVWRGALERIRTREDRFKLRDKRMISQKQQRRSSKEEAAAKAAATAARQQLWQSQRWL